MSTWFKVTFKNGTSFEEYGSDAQDVREFVSRSYWHLGTPVSVIPVDLDEELSEDEA